VLCGKSMTADGILAEIESDRAYFGEKGGVTFSGGEPFAHPEILGMLLDKCRENKINSAVETSLFIWNEELFKKCDLVMADFKIWDSALHEKYTGVPNEKIKENFVKLNALGLPIIARTPIIPEIEQGIDKISEFLKGLSSVISYELLPYHPLGKSKYEALGRDFTEFSVPSKEFMKGISEKYAYVQR